MSTQPHDFNERKQWSLQARDEPFWDAVYHKAFPNMTRSTLVDDLKLQKLGIDRVLYLSNDIALTVDEKKRDRTDTGDILLEYAHKGGYNRPGWMELDSAIDYLAYAFIPSGRCYLFDWRMLRRAWCQYKDAWMLRYPHIQAPNRTYMTWSVAVPIDIVYAAALSASVINVDI